MKWYIAPGALTGSIYYNSYDDPQAEALLGYGGASGGGSMYYAGGGNAQGSVMRLAFGASKPQVYLLFTGPPMPTMGDGPCISCHSVSANGSSMFASYSLYGGGYGGTTSGPVFNAFGYDIQTHPAPQPPEINTAGIPAATFAALTADGKYLLTMGNPQCTAGAETYPRAPNNFSNLDGPVDATLWDVQAGKTVSAKGLTASSYMWMPQFSPDGKKIVFNNAHPGSDGRTDRRELATMDYDETTQTFSNLQVVYEDDGPAPSLPYTGWTAAAGAGPVPMGAGGCTQNNQPSMGTTFNDTCSDVCYPGWPFFTPDGNKVIFVRGTEPDFFGYAPGLGRMSPSVSKLYILDVATKKAHELVNANSGPSSMDLGYDYASTVMPVAAGGKFWAFFTSRRTYGNVAYPGLTMPDSKKIWGTAIDIGAAPDVDPSHPPFYLAGQGGGGNLRAFPVLNPCKANGETCASGLDCCAGSCIGGMCGVRPVQMCAMTNDKCTASSDCCDKTQQCIGGYCAVYVPQ